jgi:para-nitrobenzyl esterase
MGEYMTLRTLFMMLALGMGLCLAGLGRPAFAADGPIVNTTEGRVAGAAGEGADTFLGIPYAAPPIGALRWKPPSAAARWTDARDATKHATRCSAPSAGDGPRIVNEDCLYLDVYRPAGVAAGANLPVTVFIPGGGNYSGSIDIYDGSRMAAEGKTIVVALAYRLGAFGFLALPGLTAEDSASGSGDYALLDQIKALQWVRDNIAAFGGNPADVTLTGQSSGGTNVCGLLAAPAAKGLYNRAMIQSGICQVTPDLASAEKSGAAFAEKLGCSDPATMAACLRDKPADAVLDNWPSSPTGAAYGTKLLPASPMQAFATGAFNAVPTLIGFARNEMFGFMHGLYPLSETAFETMVKTKFPDTATELLIRYAADKYPHNEYAFGALQGDSFFVCHAFKLADLISKYAPVSMYEFADMTVPNWKSLGNAQHTPPGYHVGAGHTSELYYLFGYQAIERPLDATQLDLARTLIGMWVDFGRKTDAKEWPPYSASDREVVELQPPSAGGIKTSVDAYRAHNCDFWNKD